MFRQSFSIPLLLSFVPVSSQHIGDVSAGATAGAGFIHLVTENAAFISIGVMLISAAVAIVFHVLGYVLKRRELEVLEGDHMYSLVKRLLQCMDSEQDRASLKRAARFLKEGV